jgi:hypothetical protein
MEREMILSLEEKKMKKKKEKKKNICFTFSSSVFPFRQVH